MFAVPIVVKISVFRIGDSPSNSGRVTPMKWASSKQRSLSRVSLVSARPMKWSPRGYWLMPAPGFGAEYPPTIDGPNSTPRSQKHTGCSAMGVSRPRNIGQR